jgi:hypothetical protein
MSWGYHEVMGKQAALSDPLMKDSLETIKKTFENIW